VLAASARTAAVALNISAAGAAFDPAETMTDVIEMTLEAGAFVMSPVAGTKAPVVFGKNAEGDVGVSGGRPLKARTTIGSRDVVGLGRDVRGLIEVGAAEDDPGVDRRRTQDHQDLPAGVQAHPGGPDRVLQRALIQHSVPAPEISRACYHKPPFRSKILFNNTFIGL